MRPQEKAITVVVTGIVLVALAFGLYFFAQLFGSFFADLDAAIGRTALVGFTAVFLSALIIARGLSRRATGADSVASEKAAMYHQLLTLLSGGEPPAAGQPPVTLQEVERQLVVRARKSVLDRYMALRAFGPHPDPDDPNARAALQRLVLEIRRDLGHRDGPFAVEGAVDLVMVSKPPRPTEAPGADRPVEAVPRREPVPAEPSAAPDPRGPKPGEFRISTDRL